MVRESEGSGLKIRCRQHSRYTAARIKPKTKCPSCRLLHIIRWQWDKRGEEKLGSVNPYALLIGDVDLEEAAAGLRAYFS